MINLRINTIIRLTNFTTALAWELYKHKVKKMIPKIREDFSKWGGGSTSRTEKNYNWKNGLKIVLCIATGIGLLVGA